MGARYHVRLTKGMRDVFGQVLERDIAFDVDVEAPFLAAGKPRQRDRLRRREPSRGRRRSIRIVA